MTQQWITDAAERIFTYAIEWNEGRKKWRTEDIENIIKSTLVSQDKPDLDACICGHGFTSHEHPARERLTALNGKMLTTELGKCKLCDCHAWREITALLDEVACDSR